MGVAPRPAQNITGADTRDESGARSDTTAASHATPELTWDRWQGAATGRGVTAAGGVTQPRLR